MIFQSSCCYKAKKCGRKVSTWTPNVGRSERYFEFKMFFVGKCPRASRHNVSLSSFICMLTSTFTKDTWSLNYSDTSLTNVYHLSDPIYGEGYFRQAVITSQCKHLQNILPNITIIFCAIFKVWRQNLSLKCAISDIFYPMFANCVHANIGIFFHQVVSNLL